MLRGAVAVGAGLVAVYALAWAVVALKQMAAIGAAYKAKVLATLIFGAGRALNPGTAEEVSADSYWPLRLFRTRIDRRGQLVKVRLGPFAPRTAAFRAGFGAVLLAPDASLPAAASPITTVRRQSSG